MSLADDSNRPRSRRRRRRVAMLTPLAVLAVGGTASLSAGGSTSPEASAPSPSAEPARREATPDAADPATTDRASRVSVASFGAGQPVASALADDIPSAALAAYQRAESVLTTADRSCHLTWQLVAALGRVESDHGRFGGSALDADGLAVPAIVGPVLDGHHGTTEVADTDAGRYDGDTRHDRAVGPLQLIPSTWASVGVDADNDGTRNPQDVDDAALGAAVYLCSGTEDLGTDAGRRAAVRRYNHSDAYVDVVLSVMDGYLAGSTTVSAPTTVLAGQLSEKTTAPIGPIAPVRTAVQSPVQLVPDTDWSSARPAVVEVDLEQPALEQPGGPTTEPAEPTELTGPAEPTVVVDELTGLEPTTEPSKEPTAGPTDPWVPTRADAAGLLALLDATETCGTDEQLVDDPNDDADAFDTCLVFYTVPAEVPEALLPLVPAVQGLVASLAEAPATPSS